MNDLANLFSTMCQPRQLEVAAGGTVFQQGDQASDIFLVVNGQVRLIRYTTAGESLTQYRAMPGQTFAEAALFSDMYHCTAVADMESKVACFPKKRLLQGLEEQPKVMLKLVAHLSRQVRDLRTLLEIRSIRSAPARILQYLRLQANPQTGAYTVPGHLKDLAVELGLAHETFYRVLAALEKEGRIKRNDRLIQITP